MSFSLSFSPDFFFNPEAAEPYDGLGDTSRPVSVWAAIHSLMEDREAWASMCEDCFPGTKPEHVTAEAVLEMIRETDSCSTLTSPIDVAIDSEGFHSVRVYS